MKNESTKIKKIMMSFAIIITLINTYSCCVCRKLTINSTTQNLNTESICKSSRKFYPTSFNTTIWNNNQVSIFHSTNQ